MGDLHSEIHQNNGIRTKASVGSEALHNRTLSTQAWSNSLNEPGRQACSTDVAVEDTVLFTPLSEPSLGFILKMASSLLQPVCLGGSPVVRPVHLQVAGGADVQAGQTIASPVIAPSPGSMSLPLILDQAGLQNFSSQLLLQTSCLIPEQPRLSGAEQNHGSCQNLSMPLNQLMHGEGKSDTSSLTSENTALHCSKFTTTVLQEPFHFIRNYDSSACQGTRLSPSNPFLPQESPLPYSYTGSPLVSLVPPATLLVPYPLIVPLPVPLPIPIPIPVPVSFPGSKILSSSSHTSFDKKRNKSTQTPIDIFGFPTSTYSRKSDCRFRHLPRLPPPLVSQQEVLDLRIKATPIQTKQEVQFSLQDSALDLSVTNKSHFKSCTGSSLKCYGNNSTNQEPTERVIRPIKYLQRRESSHFNGHSDTEFGMQYTWTMEKYFDKNTARCPGQNIRPLQTSAVFCEKLLRQPQEHLLKNRVARLKRVTSQSTNTHPIKKQHVATFHPAK